MKASFFTLFHLFSVALGAAASQPVEVTSIVSDISEALNKLDTSVKAFKDDPTAVQADAEDLISTIKSCTCRIKDSTDLAGTDAISLTEVIVSFTSKSLILIEDMKVQREAFELITLCKPLHKTISDICSETTKLTQAICGKMPDASHSLAAGLASGLIDSLTRGTSYFDSDNCQDDIQPSAPSVPTSLLTSFEAIPPPATTPGTEYPTLSELPSPSPTLVTSYTSTFDAIPPPPPTAVTTYSTTFDAIPPPSESSKTAGATETLEVTVTVTDTNCESSAATPPPATSSSAPVATTISTPITSYTPIPTITTSFTVPGNTTTYPGSTGGVPTSSYPTAIPTAAAAINVAKHAGILVGLAAALVL